MENTIGVKLVYPTKNSVEIEDFQAVQLALFHSLMALGYETGKGDDSTDFSFYVIGELLRHTLENPFSTNLSNSK